MIKRVAANLALTVLAFIVCGIPAWIWLGFRALASPEGFGLMVNL